MLNLKDDACPFCNGNSLQRFSVSAHDAASRHINIIECQACQVAWQWPLQRTEQQSVAVFENNYAERDEDSYFDPKKRESISRYQCKFLESKFGVPGRLLDIGCGDGNFARHMASRGWHVVGIDPAIPSVVTKEKTKGSLRLQPGNIAGLPDHEMFDVVTLWDVVEHVERPDQLIAEATSRLAPGGMLVVETGNYQSAGRVESLGTWWNYQLDHRWYLAPPQLRMLLSKAGLEHIEVADHVLRPWWKGKTDMQAPRFHTLVKAIIKRPWRIRIALRCHQELMQGYNKWHGWGGMEIMTMIGYKPKTA